MIQSGKRNSPAQNNEDIHGDELDDIPIGELTIVNGKVTKASASEKISHETYSKIKGDKRIKRGHNENRKKDNTDKNEHRFSIFAQSESEKEDAKSGDEGNPNNMTISYSDTNARIERNIDDKEIVEKIIEGIFENSPVLLETSIAKATFYLSEETLTLITQAKIDMASLLLGTKQHKSNNYKKTVSNINYNLLFQEFVDAVAKELNNNTSSKIEKRSEVIDKINKTSEVVLLPFILSLRLSNLFGDKVNSYKMFYEKQDLYRAAQIMEIPCLPCAKGKQKNGEYTMPKKTIKDNTRSVRIILYMYLLLST